MNRLWDIRMKSHHDATRALNKLKPEYDTLSNHLNEDSLTLNKAERCIYIHVPFCHNICSFCNTRRTKGDPGDEYIELLKRQIDEYSKHYYINKGRYDSVYFGGGTPTTLSGKGLAEIMKHLKNNFNILPDAEISADTISS